MGTSTESEYALSADQMQDHRTLFLTNKALCCYNRAPERCNDRVLRINHVIEDKS